MENYFNDYLRNNTHSMGYNGYNEINLFLNIISLIILIIGLVLIYKIYQNSKVKVDNKDNVNLDETNKVIDVIEEDNNNLKSDNELLDILKRRLIMDEIDEEEYLKKKELLGK